MRLKKLRAVNFRCFENIDIDFPNQGLVLLNGKSSVSGDGSGTGKSSIFHAISYVLDIMPPGFPGSEQLTWGRDRMFVELTLQKGDTEIFIRKGYKPILTVGDKEFTSPKTIQEELPKALGVDLDILQNLVYRAQDERGAFLKLSDKEKKEFLCKVVPELVKIEQEAAKAAANIQALENTKANLKLEIKSTREARKLIEDKEPNLSGLPKAKEGLAKVVGFLSQLKQPNPMALNEEERLKEEEANKTRDALAKIKASVEGNERALEIMISKRYGGSSNKKYLALEKEKRRLLEMSLCPTCKKPMDNTEGLIMEVDAKIEEYKKNIADYESHNTLEAELKRKIEIERPAIRSYEWRYATANSEFVKIRKEKNELYEKEMSEYNTKLAQLTAIKDTFMSEIRTLESKKCIYEANVAKYDSLTELIKTKEAELASTVEKLAREESIYEAIGYKGFLGVIFNEILKEIEYGANKILKNMANASHISVNLDTETTNKKGDTKNAISTKISSNGTAATFASGLSGGQKTSIDLAVHLSLLDVLANRCGINAQFLMLDEVFNGHGHKTKESVLEMLKESASDKLIMIIDHDTTFKALFDTTLDIQHDGRYSTAAFVTNQ